jgi:hypothetical protein
MNAPHEDAALAADGTKSFLCAGVQADIEAATDQIGGGGVSAVSGPQDGNSLNHVNLGYGVHRDGYIGVA